MTNTEAITKLTNIMHDDHYSWHPSILTAFNMAVDALRQSGQAEPKEMVCGTCKNSDSATLYCTNPPQVKCKKSGKLHFVTDYCDLPSAQPEPSYEAIKEYCRKRCLSIVDTALLEKYLPSAQPEQRWIPCSERLPGKEKKTYWVCTDTEYQCECRWTNNRFGLGEGEWGWSIFDTPQYSKPIAWMPLPAPYQKEGEEE